jgi:hypothetical protein
MRGGKTRRVRADERRAAGGQVRDRSARAAESSGQPAPVPLPQHRRRDAVHPLFFDRKPGAPEPWTKTVWVYDLRTNRHFTLKTKRMTRADLDAFVECYRPADRHNRRATWAATNPEGRWRPFAYDEIIARDNVSLDLFWLRDESLEDSANLPSLTYSRRKSPTTFGRRSRR